MKSSVSVQVVEGALSPFSKSGRQLRGLSMGASTPAMCFRVPAQGPAVWGLGARRGHTRSKAFVLLSESGCSDQENFFKKSLFFFFK